MRVSRLSRCLVARGVRFVSVVSAASAHGQGDAARHGQPTVKCVRRYCVNGQVGGKYLG